MLAQKEKTVRAETILRMGALGMACLLAAAGTRAQGAAPAATPAKIGVISARVAIANTAEGKQAIAELQSRVAPQQSELDGLNKQVNDLRQRLAAGERTLSDEEKARLQRDGEGLVRRLQRKQDEFNEDVNNAQNEISDRIGRKMGDVLERFARENGYVAVLDTSTQGTPVLYASNTIDITQDIVRLYDQAYPVKSAAAAATPKPAAAKPAAQKPPQ